MNNSCKFFILSSLLVLLLIIGNSVYAQEYNEQLAFSLSNDKFADKDQYYTNGIFFTYKRVIKNSFLLNNTYDKQQYAITIGNEIYTPKNITSTSSNDFDRSYAGWLFGEYELTSINESKAFIIALETGITGRESFSGRLQTWYHNFFGIESSPPWTQEIAFKVLFNLKAAYVFNWELNRNNALDYKINASLGTKDIFLENNIRYTFGKFNAFNNTSRIGAIDLTNSNEFYGYISIGHKYVAHNVLIHGSLFKNEVLFTTPIENNILKLEIGSVFKIKRSTFKIVYNYNSKETPLAEYHAYGTFAYLINF